MKVIFVCTGNTCRSPMAEYIMRDYCKKNNLDIVVESRGVACSNGRPISENSKLALAEIGIDASEHKSQSFTLKDLFEADLIVTMTEGHKRLLVDNFNAGDNVKSFGEIAGCDINDPYGSSLAVYKMCLAMIEDGVKTIVDKILGK